MYEDVVLAVYRSMVVIITFLGGFVLIVGLNLLKEMGVMAGTYQGFMDVKRIEEDSVKNAVRTIAFVKESRGKLRGELFGWFGGMLVGLSFILFMMSVVGMSGWGWSVYVVWLAFVIMLVVLLYVVRDLIALYGWISEGNRKLEVCRGQLSAGGKIVVREMEKG